MRSGVADQAAVVTSVGEMTVDDFREEPIGPVGMLPLSRRIEFLHVAPYPRAMLQDRYFEALDAFVRNVHDVLRVMQQRHGIVIAAGEQDLPIQLDESLERGVMSNRVIPRLPREEILGVPAPRDESCRVRIDARPWIRPQHLYESAVVASGARRLSVERWQLLENLRLLVDR